MEIKYPSNPKIKIKKFMLAKEDWVLNIIQEGMCNYKTKGLWKPICLGHTTRCAMERLETKGIITFIRPKNIYPGYVIVKEWKKYKNKG